LKFRVLASDRVASPDSYKLEPGPGLAAVGASICVKVGPKKR